MRVDQNLLSADGVSKKFTRSLRRSLYYGGQDIARDLLGRSRRSELLRPGEFWAVKNLSFQLARGEALGLIGRNGSGKTTLLRLISGLIKIDAGSIALRGRVAPLIALGAGFSPVLTGRENIYVNMAILGLTEKQITAKFDEVVAFAELGEAIDGPVQTYSSGMAARLGFSCAIHTDPDLLLVDEVLSVGDVRFRTKCYRRLSELRRKGTSVVLVSHSHNSIMALCDRVLYLADGAAVMCGRPQETLARFERDLALNFGETVGELTIAERTPSASTGIDIRRVYLRDASGSRVPALQTGQPGSLCIECKVRSAFPSIGLALIIREAGGEPGAILNLDSGRDGVLLVSSTGVAELSCNLDPLGLRPGIYTAKLSITAGAGNTVDAVEAFTFDVKGGADTVDCAFYQPRSWYSSLLPGQD